MDSGFSEYLILNFLSWEADSVQFTSVVSKSLQPHGLQHPRPPCPSPTLGACSNSYPSRQWCHSIISSSVVPFSSHLQSFPASGTFPVSQFFTSGGQRIGVSASSSVLQMNIQDWFPLGLTGLFSLQPKRDSQESSPTPQLGSISFSALSLLYGPTLTSVHDYWKNHSFDYPELHRQSPFCSPLPLCFHQVREDHLPYLGVILGGRSLWKSFSAGMNWMMPFSSLLKSCILFFLPLK